MLAESIHSHSKNAQISWIIKINYMLHKLRSPCALFLMVFIEKHRARFPSFDLSLGQSKLLGFFHEPNGVKSNKNSETHLQFWNLWNMFSEFLERKQFTSSQTIPNVSTLKFSILQIMNKLSKYQLQKAAFPLPTLSALIRLTFPWVTKKHLKHYNHMHSTFMLPGL